MDLAWSKTNANIENKTNKGIEIIETKDSRPSAIVNSHDRDNDQSDDNDDTIDTRNDGDGDGDGRSHEER